MDEEKKPELAIMEVEGSTEGYGIPTFALSELMRLGHAYLSIQDPQRRLEALRMLEAIAGASPEKSGERPNRCQGNRE